MINVGSALSDRAIPLQGIYCGAKHALKAFTDTLRMELEDEGAPISVTLVKPASIDTPFFEKARTYLGVEPQPVPPVYAPEVVAGVILHAAQHPLRELIAGGSGAKLSAARFAPARRQTWSGGRSRRRRPTLRRRRDAETTSTPRSLPMGANAAGTGWAIRAVRASIRKRCGRWLRPVSRRQRLRWRAPRGASAAASRRSKAKLEQKPAGNPSELGFGVS